MPNIPIPPAAPYETVEYVLQLARARINDMEQSVAGDLLSDTQPYTVPLLNGGWRRFQDTLANNGIEKLTKEIDLIGLPPVNNPGDPAMQVYMGWANSYDGVNTFATPLLPQDMLLPLRLWERQTANLMDFIPMEQANDGLPASMGHLSWNRYWDWRNDSIWFPGATQSNDLRLRYVAYLPDLALAGNVPVLKAASAVAFYLCAEFADARGSPLADAYWAKGDADVKKLIGRTARRKQGATYRRRAYGRRRY
jgi:hypothetical protein